MTKPFDPAKPVQTRDGRKARIICSDRADPRIPIVALWGGPGSEGVSFHYADGSQCGGLGRGGDLVNLPERKEMFFNIYADNHFGETHHVSVEICRQSQAKHLTYLGIAKITYEDDLPVSIEVIERYDG